MNEQHLLVDYENVQPAIEDLLMLAPKLTDVWLFHGPNQIRRAKQLQAAHERVTLVPHSGKGKNALDFHLSFYLGYVAAKHPAASLMVVANDKGYDAMIGHAKLLGFTASRVEFRAKQAAAEKKVSAPAKKSAVAKTVASKQVAVQAGGKSADAAKASVKQSAPAKTATAKRAVAKKAPAQKAAVAKKTAPAKKVTAKKSSAKPAISVKSAAAKQAPAKAAPSAAQKVLARAKTSLAKMGTNRPTKFAALLRHLKSIVGQGATEANADAMSHSLEEAKVIQVVGDLVLYP